MQTQKIIMPPIVRILPQEKRNEEKWKSGPATLLSRNNEPIPVRSMCKGKKKLISKEYKIRKRESFNDDGCAQQQKCMIS